MANEPKKVRQRRSMLQMPGVQTILSSLLCIVLGLLVGFVVLLLIDHGVSEKTGNLNAIDAILVIIKNFWKYGSSTAQMKYLGNTLVKLSETNPQNKHIYAVGDECRLVFAPDAVHVL